MSAARRVPRRPASHPVAPDGTDLRRSYVAPADGDAAQLGDIVSWGGRQWDVTAWSVIAAHGRRWLQLSRRVRDGATRTRVIIDHADETDVVILGRQVLLPGLAPQDPEPDRD